MCLLRLTDFSIRKMKKPRVSYITPCWYPIHFCQMTNKSVILYPCTSVEDAANQIRSFVESLKKQQ